MKKKGAKSKQKRALEEFLSEAQDISEHLGTSLMAIDEALKDGEPDPDLVNDIFRGMHTLKSLSGMFEVKPLAEMAHHEEALLEEVRLGRVEFGPDLLDLLFESLELLSRILTMVGEKASPDAADDLKEAAALTMRLRSAVEGDGDDEEQAGEQGVPRDPKQIFGSDVLEVLTEYEEHRLTTNLERGFPFLRIRTRFALESIDVDLDKIKNQLKPVGEIITYLPSTDEAELDRLGIDIVLAVHSDRNAVELALDGFNAEIEEITGGDREEGTPTPGAHTKENDGPLPDDAETSRPTPPIKTSVSLAPPGEDERQLSLRSVSQSVRVDIRKLDRLMNAVGELAIVRKSILRISEQLRASLGRSDLAIELHRIGSGFDRRLEQLRDGILEVRMVPLSHMFDRLARLVRKISRGLGKDIHFVMSGAETEVDKLIVEELSDPLMHIVRNAIDHGVEDATERKAAGKPEFGTVALTAYQKGNHVMIEVEDDGAGIDGERLVEVALSRGLIDHEQVDLLSPADVMNLIFLPGISTSEMASEISGRGVGMDVVKTNIAALGGHVEVLSEPGIGTKISITLPVTLAIIPTLLVVVGQNTYAVPLNTVAEAIFVPSAEIRSVLGTETTSLRGDTLPLCRLSEFFGGEAATPRPAEACVVVTTIGQRRLGLEVDSLIGQQDVVIKALGRSLRGARSFSGATDIGDDQLALVLDTAAIMEEFFDAVGGADQHLHLAEG